MSARDVVSTTLGSQAIDAYRLPAREQRAADADAVDAPSLLDRVHGVFGDAALQALLGRRGQALPLPALRHTALRPAAEFLARPGKGFRGRLVALGWQLAGGAGQPPPVLAHLTELIHAGSMIVDDVEDGSTHRRGAPTLHELYGTPLAINTGNLLYFLPFEMLGALQVQPAIELELHRCLTRTMLRAHFGQGLDLGTCADQIPQAELPCVVQAISELKTGSLMELAASIGAISLGASSRAQALGDFGAALGVALQMLDDLGNLGARDPYKHCEDLRLGRPTWVWAWLAADLSPAAFAALQTEAASVRAGASPPHELAAQLRAALGESGRRRARHAVRRALAGLRRAIGARPSLRVLERECARLLVSYG